MRSRHWLVAAACLVVICTWCGWVSGFHRSTLGAEVTWPVSLAAVVAFDLLLWRGGRGRVLGLRLPPASKTWPRPGRGGARLALEGTSPWLGLALVVLAWEILGIDTGKHQAHLTISAITQAFRPMNAAMLLVWMATGAGYAVALARAPGPAPYAATNRRRSDADSPNPRPKAVVFPLLPVSALRSLVPALLLPSSRPAGVVFWLAVVAAAVLIDQLARRSQGRFADAEELVRFIATPRWANIVLVLAWAYAGYHLFAR